MRGAGAVSPSTSPSLAVWGSYQQPRATFAHALHAHTTSTAPRAARPGERENEWEIDAAWEAFDRLDLEPKDPEAGDTDPATPAAGGGKKKGGKKGGKKQVLVLGGGARRGA